jgi:Rps23 Pro-64 3,4-dihydroxylase Tpa1-like proline 4-hydroxylase
LEPPDRTSVLESAVDQLRGQGKLDEARSVLAHLVELMPQHAKARRLLATLSGGPFLPMRTADGLSPAPFVLIRNFLPLDVRNAIFDFVVSRNAEFEPARMNSGLYPDVRRTSFLEHCLTGLSRRWRTEFDHRLQSALLAALPRLGVPRFSLSGTELHALLYRQGDFFRTHQDNSPGGSRAVTFIYNLHRAPKAFTGGELLLYDTYDDSLDGVGGRGHATTHTRIEPEDNRLILFPPNYFHEVTPVKTASDDGARIAVNGWFHRNPGE